MVRTVVKRAPAWRWRLRGLRWTVPCAIAGMAIAVVAGASGAVPALVGGVVALCTTGYQILGRRSVVIRRDALYIHDLDGNLGSGRCVIPWGAVGSITPIVTLPIMPATNRVSRPPEQTTALETSAAAQTGGLSVRQIAPAAVADTYARQWRSAATRGQPLMYEWHHGRLLGYRPVRSNWLDRRVIAFGEFLVSDRRLVLPRPNLRIQFAEPRLIRRRTLIGRRPLPSSHRRDGMEIAVRDVDGACQRLDTWLAGH